MIPATSVAPEAGVLAVLPLAGVFASAAELAEACVWVAEFAGAPLAVPAARSLFSLSEIDAALVVPLPPDGEMTLFWPAAPAFTIRVRFPSAVALMPASSVFAVSSAVAEASLDCAVPDLPDGAGVSVEFVPAVLLAVAAPPAADPSDALEVCFVAGWGVSGVAV